MLGQISQNTAKVVVKHQSINQSINQSQVTENEKVIVRNHRIKIALNHDSCVIID